MSNEKNGKKIRNVKIREEEPRVRPKRMKAEDFLRGRKVEKGTRLGE